MITYVPCQCGCRPDGAPQPCGCPECRPGPGLDQGLRRELNVRLSRARMRVLLARPTLTDPEQVELDELLLWYLRTG